MRYDRRALAIIAPLAGLVTAVSPAETDAAEWAIEPTVTLREEYNDNYRLTRTDPDKVWQTVLDPRVTLRRRTEVSDVNVSGRVRASYFSGETGLNTVDNFLDLSATRSLERGSLGISAALSNDTTLQDEVLDIDTGITVQQVDRTRKSLSVNGTYMLNETLWLEGSIGLTNVEYEDGQRYNLFDYDYLTPSLRVIHQWNPKTQVFGVLSHSRVEYDSARDLESKTDSLQVGASYDFTETWSVSGSVGSRRTDTSELVPDAVERPGFEFLYPLVYDIVYQPRDSESTGLVYDASLSREFETGTLTLAASQSVTPSSTGTETEATRFSLTGTRRFSAKLSGTLAVTYYQSSTVGDVTTRADNDRYRIAPSLAWKVDEDLTLNTGYIYTAVERGATGGNKVDSNAVFASVRYAWPRMTMSR